MKILFISNIPSPYNVAFLDEIGKTEDVLAVFERYSSSERDDSWKIIQAEHFTYIILKGIKIGLDMAYAPGVKKVIRENRNRKIIIANPVTPTGICAINYCRRHGIPYALQSEGGMAKNGKGLKEKFKTWLMKDATLYLSGMSLKNEYFLQYGATPDRVKQYPFTSLYERDILNQPLSCEEKTALREKLGIQEEKVIISVGMFTHNKGHDLLLKACKGLSDKVGIYLVGGSPTAELTKIESELSLNNVHYVDFMNKEKLSQYYCAADIFVLMTRGDTWGLVINESMAKGLPVITTDQCVAGMELIENGVNGYLIHTEDVEELQKRLWYLLDNPQKCEEMGKENLKRICGYSYENMAKNHIEILERYM